MEILFQADEYPINEKVALQLAGLQAQVALGDPQEGKTEFYADITSYLPSRIAQTRKQAEWVRSFLLLLVLVVAWFHLKTLVLKTKFDWLAAFTSQDWMIGQYCF